MAKSTQKVNSKKSSGEQNKEIAETKTRSAPEAEDKGAEQEVKDSPVKEQEENIPVETEVQESPVNAQSETEGSPVTTSVGVIEVELAHQIEASEDGFTVVTYGPGKSSLPPVAARHALSKNALEKVDIDKVENFLKIRGS